MQENKKTLVIGASINPDRYSNKAVQLLSAHGHEVVAFGNKLGNINGINIITHPVVDTIFHTVTLYLNPENQHPYYDYILSLNPKRIIFNPGTENEELEHLAQQKGILIMKACTLVLLKTNQY